LSQHPVTGLALGGDPFQRDRPLSEPCGLSAPSLKGKSRQTETVALLFRQTLTSAFPKKAWTQTRSHRRIAARGISRFAGSAAQSVYDIFGLRRAQDEDGDEWKIADLAVFLMLRL